MATTLRNRIIGAFTAASLLAAPAAAPALAGDFNAKQNVQLVALAVPETGSFVTSEEARKLSEGCDVTVIHAGWDIYSTDSDASSLSRHEKIKTISLRGGHNGYAEVHMCGLTNPQKFSQKDVLRGKLGASIAISYPKIVEYVRSKQTASLNATPTPNAN